MRRPRNTPRAQGARYGSTLSIDREKRGPAYATLAIPPLPQPRAALAIGHGQQFAAEGIAVLWR